MLKGLGGVKEADFENPVGVLINSKDDLYDIDGILSLIKGKKIEEQGQIDRFLRSELDVDLGTPNLDSNLLYVIRLLSKDDLKFGEDGDVVPFEIESKIEYNGISASRLLIEDYALCHSRLNKIYSEFDEMGQNKSRSVLASIRKEYASLSKLNDPDEIFFGIIDNLINVVRADLQYGMMGEEELVMYVQILVVDAFIRCRVFKNPNLTENAAS